MPVQRGPIPSHHPTGVPLRPIRYQDDPGLLILSVPPNNHDPYLVIHVGNPQGAGEVPLLPVALLHRLADGRGDLLRQVRGFHLPTLILQLAIELQGADITPNLAVALPFALNMVQNRGIREVTVEGEGARNVPLADPIDQLLAQDGVVFEGDLPARTIVLLLKAAELQRIVLAVGADIVDEEIVVSDLVTFLGVVPEPTGIFDQFPGMVDQRIVNRNDPCASNTGWKGLPGGFPTVAD